MGLEMKKKKLLHRCDKESLRDVEKKTSPRVLSVEEERGGSSRKDVMISSSPSQPESSIAEPKWNSA